jgi:two-component system, cell cycle sensor histidine kinase and response regulator CckA
MIIVSPSGPVGEIGTGSRRRAATDRGTFSHMAGLPFTPEPGRMMPDGDMQIGPPAPLPAGVSSDARPMATRATTILERISDAFVALDTEFRYTYVNARAGELLGCEPEALIGKHIWTEFPGAVGTPVQLACERAMREQEAVTVLDHYRPWDRWFEDRIYPSSDGITIFFTDVTERRRGAEALRESEERFRALFFQSPTGVFLYDRTLRITECNQRFIDILGSSREALIGLDMHQLRDQRVLPAIEEALHGREGSYEGPYAATTSQVHAWIAMRVSPLRDGSGSVVGGIGVVEDRTDVERDRSALQESQARFRDLAESIPQVFWLSSVSGDSLYISPAFEGIWGRSIEEVAAKPGLIMSDLHPEDRQRAAAAFAAMSLERVPDVEYRIVRPDGEVRWLSTSGFPVRDGSGAIVRIAGITEDITSQKEAHRALKTSEERLALALEGAEQGFWDWNVQSGSLYLSSQWERMLGYEPGEVEPHVRSWEQMTHPEDLPWALKAVREHLRGDTPIYETEHRIRHKQGHWIWVLDRGKVVERDAAGEPMRMIGTHTDVTRSKHAEEELRRQKDLLQTVFDRLPVMLGLFDERGRLEWVNRAWERVLGFSASDPEGMALSPDLPSGPATGEGPDHGVEGEPNWRDVPVRRRGGEIAWLHWATVRLSDGRSIGIGQDVTAQRHLEEQLGQAQKMEAVGQLAGGVAHDFNNLLTVISGHASMLLWHLPEDEIAQESLDAIREAAGRAASLTAQLLAFGRKQILHPRVLDLNAVVRQAHGMVRRLVRASIEIHLDLDPHIGRVRVDPTQIDQVLLNLTLNARDALPATGGRIRISTRNRRVDASDRAQHRSAEPGEYVCLSVEDNGCGIRPEHIPRLFDPFFTTKGVGEGTGLGLSTVFGIVEQSSGCILVRSQPGMGAVFDVLLPRIEEAPDASGDTAGPPGIPKGEGVVLLVEDDPQVRTLARRILEQSGYTVLDAPDGEQALRLVAAGERPPDLLLTDVVMPRLGGQALAGRLLERHPGLKVIFMSGYAGEAIAREGGLEIGDAFIQKPFTPASLMQLVREVLDG